MTEEQRVERGLVRLTRICTCGRPPRIIDTPNGPGVEGIGPHTDNCAVEIACRTLDAFLSLQTLKDSP